VAVQGVHGLALFQLLQQVPRDSRGSAGLLAVLQTVETRQNRLEKQHSSRVGGWSAEQQLLLRVVVQRPDTMSRLRTSLNM
jgi:hypothetical protein